MAYSILDISEIIDDVGLDKAILDEISPTRIKDPELAALWDEARDVLIRIQEYLDNNLDDEDDEELFYLEEDE